MIKRKEKEVVAIKNDLKTLDNVLKIIFKKTKGHINGETKSYSQFKKEIRQIFSEQEYLPSQIALELNIGNKIKYSTIIKTAWGYDYYIPETREDEERLKKETGYYDA